MVCFSNFIKKLRAIYARIHRHSKRNAVAIKRVYQQQQHHQEKTIHELHFIFLPIFLFYVPCISFFDAVFYVCFFSVRSLRCISLNERIDGHSYYFILLFEAIKKFYRMSSFRGRYKK